MLGQEKKLVPLRPHDLESDVTEQLAQRAKREEFEVPLSIRIVLSEPREPMTIFLPRARLGEHGLYAGEQERAVEPARKIRRRDDKRAAGPKHPSYLLDARVGIEDVFDDFPHDCEIDRTVRKGESLGHVLHEDTHTLALCLVRRRFRYLDTDTADTRHLVDERPQQVAAPATEIQDGPWLKPHALADETTHPVIELCDVRRSVRVEVAGLLASIGHLTRLHGNTGSPFRRPSPGVDVY